MAKRPDKPHKQYTTELLTEKTAYNIDPIVAVKQIHKGLIQILNMILSSRGGENVS